MTPEQCNLREASFCRLFCLEVARALSFGLTQAVARTHSQERPTVEVLKSEWMVKWAMPEYERNFADEIDQPYLYILGQDKVQILMDCGREMRE